MSNFFGIAFVALYAGSIIICFRKGKPGMGIGGLFTWGVLSVVGAVRLAKPDSPWAWKNYPPYGPKMVMAWSRFGDEPFPSVSPTLPPTERAPSHQTPDGALKPRVIPSGPEFPPIPGLDPIGDKLRELSAHFAAAGSSLEILEQSNSSAEVRVSQRFIGSRSRRYRLTVGPGRQVQTELLEP